MTRNAVLIDRLRNIILSGMEDSPQHKELADISLILVEHVLMDIESFASNSHKIAHSLDRIADALVIIARQGDPT